MLHDNQRVGSLANCLRFSFLRASVDSVVRNPGYRSVAAARLAYRPARSSLNTYESLGYFQPPRQGQTKPVCTRIDWPIFSDRSPNRPLVQDVPNRILKRLAKEAGVDPSHVSCHKWRHAFGSRYANANINLATVQVLTGHADIATTKRYCHTTAEAQEAALAAVPINGKKKR